MVVKIYISGISGNKEVKKRQQRVLMILDSKNIKYDVIDITEPGKEADKDFMQNNSKSNGGTVSDPNPRSPLPPQLFNDEEYCGDYDQFDLANEVDTLEQFLKLEVPPEEPLQAENNEDKTVNGNVEEETNKESEETSDENNIANSTDGADESGDATATDKEGSLAKEDSPTKEAVSVTSKEGTPSVDETGDAEDSKEKSPEKQTAEKEKSVEKEGTPQPKAQSPEKEVEETLNETKKSSPEKEVEETLNEIKESSPEKEVEETLNETKKSSPEKEDVNENGAESSREHSQEKDTVADLTNVERKLENPSEALLQSEQAAAAE